MELMHLLLNQMVKINMKQIFNQYFKYDEEIYRELVDIRNKINSSADIENQINELERKITLFHASV